MDPKKSNTAHTVIGAAAIIGILAGITGCFLIHTAVGCFSIMAAAVFVAVVASNEPGKKE